MIQFIISFIITPCVLSLWFFMQWAANAHSNAKLSSLAVSNSQAANFSLLGAIHTNDTPNTREHHKVNNTIGLDYYRWQNRLVLTTVNSDEELRALQKMLRAYLPEYDERKLAIFAVVPNNAVVEVKDTGVSPAPLDLTLIVKRMQNRHTLLIGLDGGNKSAYEQFDQQQIFADIDAMPMRRF